MEYIYFIQGTLKYHSLSCTSGTEPSMAHTNVKFKLIIVCRGNSEEVVAVLPPSFNLLCIFAYVISRRVLFVKEMDMCTAGNMLFFFEVCF